MNLGFELSSLNLTEENKTIVEFGMAPQILINEKQENPQEENHTKPRYPTRRRIQIDYQKRPEMKNLKKKKIDPKDNEIESIYLSKRVKRLPSTLETIFEEPKEGSKNVLFMSTRKFKRVLNFDGILNGNKDNMKTRKRRLKAKKLKSSMSFLNRKKLSLEILKEKLGVIDVCN